MVIPNVSSILRGAPSGQPGTLNNVIIISWLYLMFLSFLGGAASGQPGTLHNVIIISWLYSVPTNCKMMFLDFNFNEFLQNFNLNGYHIPKGHALVYMSYHGHRDPRIFQFPDQFNPDRWKEG
jgi:hypothetical protein